MGQQRRSGFWWIFAALTSLVLAVGGCKPAAKQAGGEAASPTVASLVPAATDLLVGMGMGDHLVAISNYDITREETAGLPRVGDYQTTDWERLSLLRADIMIVQMAPERLPAGFRQRAEQLGIRLINVRIERLEDIFTTIEQLGEATGRAADAERGANELRGRLEAVSRRVQGRPEVATLIVLDQSARHIAGPGTYLDDVLQLAGGANAAGEFDRAYPSIDRELLQSLRPEAVIQLLPNASPQVLAEAQRAWEAVPEVPAVRDGRVYPLTEPWVMQPGWHIADLAERIAELLHPDS